MSFTRIIDRATTLCSYTCRATRHDASISSQTIPSRKPRTGAVRLESSSTTSMAHAPGGFEVSGLFQAEGARPFTITTADSSGRIAVNGVSTTLDQFRGTPYIQMDLRVSRPFNFHDRWSIVPFADMFNLFNRNNPGANYVTNIAVLPVPTEQAQAGNITDICTNTACTATAPIASPDQLRVPSGGLGDFFCPRTPVCLPFAAPLGVLVSFCAILLTTRRPVRSVPPPPDR